MLIKYKKTVLSILVLIMLLGITACGNSADKNAGSSEITRLSFKSAASYDYLKSLDGTTVTINGYMATSSPADGSFIFLMNLPYQSCPFCKPNTSQLSNTMEVYPAKDRKFDYTTQAISVTGTLEVASSEEESFTDLYGYEFNFKIVDAEYTIMKSEDLSAEMALWQQLASSDIVNEIYGMYDYTYFLCCWPSYSVNSYIDENGNTVPGFYLYASDAENLVFIDGAQYNYGVQEGYFEDLIRSIQDIDPTAFDELIECIKESEALAQKALKELEDGNYTYEYKYLEEFETEDYVYKLDKGDELEAEWEDSYSKFEDWLGKWEM